MASTEVFTQCKGSTLFASLQRFLTNPYLQQRTYPNSAMDKLISETSGESINPREVSSLPVYC